jgi:hypothetical protein
MFILYWILFVVILVFYFKFLAPIFSGLLEVIFNDSFSESIAFFLCFNLSVWTLYKFLNGDMHYFFYKFFDNTKTIDTELKKKSINNQVFKDEDPPPSGYKIAKAEQEIIEGKEVLDDWYKKPPVEPIDEEYEAEEYLKQKLEPENSEISNTLSQSTINPIDEEYEAEEYLKRKLEPDDGLDEEAPF